ncbi:phospholipase D family protein [Allosphingosinicella indica]|uniref:Phospholipase D n=1 Tax=Allosphingosinicella indica TaxID=941907 RepID=A0A1X7G0Y5_9SPHN|nr:phospholipase D-like domain-containing protein [Allosphingosinicella indica]SMF61647.1 Phosphatidylserine/phosphatidylglycerophosphate/cardiolipin synthase [Allosphingosinicella indica]
MPTVPPFIDRDSSMCAADDGAGWLCPAPPRDHCTVEPLIEAAEMYPRLERLVLGAEATVWMGFRIFDPGTKLRSDAAKALGLSDWGDLIAHKAREGIRFRILLADFEPVLADYLHAGSWSTYRRIREIIETLEESQRDRLQLLVVQHEGEMGWAIRQALRIPLGRRLRKVIDGLIGRTDLDDGGLDTRPGLWRSVRWADGKPEGWRRSPPPRLWPASYHQKFVVVDGRQVVVGGLDLNERRWDDQRHRQRANQNWHDMSALITGAVAGDAARHFATLWNREMPRYRATVAEWTDGCGRELMLDPLDKAETAEAREGEGDATVQLVRTVSRKSPTLFALGPKAVVRELKAAHRAIIGAARERLYIEAQFFRSKEAGRWIEQALEENPGLEVIILIANAPEEIAFEGQGDNPAHRHGEYLQARALERLLKTGGRDRVGLFTLAKQEEADGADAKFKKSRGTAFGAGVIHIHSKLLIADDAACLMSSANINGRSFDWDTELGVIWAERGDAITRFRRDLWGQLFDGEVPADLAEWRTVARANAKAEPEDRAGFVVPYQIGRARRFARPYFFIPDDLV